MRINLSYTVDKIDYVCMNLRRYLFIYFVIVLLSKALLFAENSGVYGDIPDYGEKYLSCEVVKFAPNGKLLVTCRTGDELLILENDKVIANIALSGHPSGIAVSEDSKFAFVTIAKAAGELALIDIENAKIIKEIGVGHFPRNPILSADSKILYIANQFANEIKAFDANTLEEIAMGRAVREPFAMTITNGKLYVLNQLPAPKGGLYEENIHLVVSVLDAKTLEKIKDVDFQNGAINGKGIASSPDGKFVYATHVLARFNVPTSQVEKGWIDTNAVSVIDTENDSLYMTFLLDDADKGAANPYSLQISADGKKLIVAHEGTHEISIVDLVVLHKKYKEFLSANKPETQAPHNDLSFLSGMRTRLSLDGFCPRYFDIKDSNLYVAMYYSDVLNKVNLDDLSVEKISIGGNEVLNEVRKGDLYFHDAALCMQQWLSCVTCHTEVRSDALNWDLLNDGIGNPKQSKSLLYAHFTPPSMITGIRKDATIAVRKGIRYIQFAHRPEEDAVAIDKYLSSLQAIESPYLVDGKLSEQAEQGAILFEMAKCAECHSGTYYTDGKKHNVGTGLNEYVDSRFDTPTLREVWRTAPYLYDGRAKSIFEMMKLNKDDKHGVTSNLSDEELRDLEAYVLTL